MSSHIDSSSSDYASPMGVPTDFFDQENDMGFDDSATGRMLQVLTDQKTNKTIKLPATARYDPENGVWIETDHHRLAQRRKQICFGKVTIGYRSYEEGVPHEERQLGNDLHPVTPRYDQVCSKRSWDSQIGHWRRMLHAWDNSPDPTTMRKSDQGLKRLLELKRKSKIHERNHFKLDGTFDVPQMVEQVPMPGANAQTSAMVYHDIEIGRADRGRCEGQPPPPLKVKCVLADDPTGRCKMVVSPKNIPFSPFKQLMQEKVRHPISRISYRDADGDMVAADDDVSLKAFLEGAGKTHPAKLHLHVDVPPELLALHNELRRAFRTVEDILPLNNEQAAGLLHELVHARAKGGSRLFCLSSNSSISPGRTSSAPVRNTPRVSPKMPALLSPPSSVGSSRVVPNEWARLASQSQTPRRTRTSLSPPQSDQGSPMTASTPMREQITALIGQLQQPIEAAC